jgi:prevent-host-death family protein
MYMKDKNEEPQGFDAAVPVHRARRSLADLINRTAYAGERIRLGRRGRAVAALVPLQDLELIEALEDRIDIEAARRALKEARGQKLIPWKRIKAELGL